MDSNKVTAPRYVWYGLFLGLVIGLGWGLYDNLHPTGGSWQFGEMTLLFGLIGGAFIGTLIGLFVDIIVFYIVKIMKS